MSKKTNAIKRREKEKVRRRKHPKRNNTSMQRYGPMVPNLGLPPGFPGFGLTLDLFFSGFGFRSPSPRDSWVCDPCGIRVDIIQPAALAPCYCLKCRGPLHRIGSPSPADCIEATAEDVTFKRLPEAKPDQREATLLTSRKVRPE